MKTGRGLLSLILMIVFCGCAFGEEGRAVGDISEVRLDEMDFKEKRKILDRIDEIKDKEKKKRILRKMVDEKDSVLKERVIIELSKTKDRDVMDELIGNLKSTDSVKVIASLEGLVNYSTYTPVGVAVSALLNHKEKNIRWKAVEVCGRARIARCVDGIVSIVKNEKEDEYVVRTAIEALYKIRTKKAVEGLISIRDTTEDKNKKDMCSNVINLIMKEKK